MINRAEQLTIKPLDCGACLLSNHGRPCHTVAEAVIRAAVNLDPTVDIPAIGTEDRVKTSRNLLASLKYREAVMLAGASACQSSQQFYNRTAAQSPLTVMT